MVNDVWLSASAISVVVQKFGGVGGAVGDVM
jgi:hypothetical protein